MASRISNRPVAYPGDDIATTPRGPVFPRLDLARLERHLPSAQRIRIEINGCLCGAPVAIPDAVTEFAIGWAFANRFFERADHVGKVSATSSHVSLMVESGADLDRCRYESIGWIPRQDLPLQQVAERSERPSRAVAVFTELEAVALAEAAFDRFDSDGARAGYVHAGLATVDDVACIARDLQVDAAACKVIGWALSTGFDTAVAMLVVNGIVDSALVETASRSGLPVVATSAVPTTGAIELARRECVTLIGLARSTRRGVFVDGGHLGDTSYPEWENLFGTP